MKTVVPRDSYDQFVLIGSTLFYGCLNAVHVAGYRQRLHKHSLSKLPLVDTWWHRERRTVGTEGPEIELLTR